MRANLDGVHATNPLLSFFLSMQPHKMKILFALLIAAQFALALVRPDRKDIAKSARWLVSSCDWGVLGTLHSSSPHFLRKDNQVFTNVVSYSDGEHSDKSRHKASGIPYFYLTELDQTAHDAKQNNWVSLTISEKQSNVDGNCKDLDAQDPRCSRITLQGKFSVAKDQQAAKSALFSKHPSMEHYPSGHKFTFYQLDIESIHFLNNFGGGEPLSVEDYFKAKLTLEEEEVVFSVTA